MLSRNYLSLQFGRLKDCEQWASSPDAFSFLFPSDGAAKFLSGPSIHTLTAGDVLVVSENFGGTLNVTKGAEVVFWWFSVQIEHLYPLFANEELCLLHGLQSRLRSCRLYRAETPVAAECHRLLAGAPPQFNLDHRSHLLRVAAVIISAELAEVRPQDNGFVRIEDHLKTVFEKLSVDELLTLSVDDLARRFSCSRRHLNRIFHNHLGYSVSALRMEMRLLKAATLLRDSQAKVINVAEQCGFNHLGLFNICFKRRFGQSPGHWRNQPAAVPNGFSPLSAPTTKCPLRPDGICPLQSGGAEESSRPVPNGGMSQQTPAPGKGGAVESERSKRQQTNGEKPRMRL